MKTIPDFFNPHHTGNYPADNIPDLVSSMLFLPGVIFGLSFTCGTALLLVYIITQDNSLLVPGFLYLYAAAAINLLVLAAMAIFGLYYFRYLLLILQKTSILLINIPIAIGYLYLLALLGMLI